MPHFLKERVTDIGKTAMKMEITVAQLAERSILKTYHKKIWSPFMKAIRDYELLCPGDKIAVCVSGGKDSMLLAKLMQMLQRFSSVPFDLVFLVMDPGYSSASRANIEKNAALLEIPVTIFESPVFSVTAKAEHSPCYLCAKMRRGYLYAKAKELGCNKIALGHHFSDVIETTLMGMLYGAQLQGMMPKLHSKNFEGMELIRPLYRVREEDIIAWRDSNGLAFLQCACRYTESRGTDGGLPESASRGADGDLPENTSRGAGGGLPMNTKLGVDGGIPMNQNRSKDGGLQGGTKRRETKELIRALMKKDPGVEMSIFNSIHAVCLDTFPGYKTHGVKHSFLEDYEPAPRPENMETAEQE